MIEVRQIGKKDIQLSMLDSFERYQRTYRGKGVGKQLFLRALAEEINGNIFKREVLDFQLEVVL